MTREQLVETINQTALNVWRDQEMILEVHETTRGHWVIRLDNVRLSGIPTAALFHTVHAMVTTATQHEPATPAMKESKRRYDADIAACLKRQKKERLVTLWHELRAQPKEIVQRCEDGVVFETEESPADFLYLFRGETTYTMFGDDARTAHELFGLTLEGADDVEPQVTFARDKLDDYEIKLIRAGHPVKIVDENYKTA